MEAFATDFMVAGLAALAATIAVSVVVLTDAHIPEFLRRHTSLQEQARRDYRRRLRTVPAGSSVTWRPEPAHSPGRAPAAASRHGQAEQLRRAS